MSVPVSLDELPQAIERFGRHPYLVMVGPDGRPRVTSVGVRWHRDQLIAGAGRRTAAAVSANAAVALLWPAAQAGDHALIVDGHATVRDDEERGAVVLIQPAKAVLHVTRAGEANAGAPDAEP